MSSGFASISARTLLKLCLALRQPFLDLINVANLLLKRLKQRAMVPVGQIGGEQGAKLIQTEAGLLRGGDQFQHCHGFGRVASVTVGLAIDDLKQANLLVEADS